MTLATNVRALRKQRKLTQKQLATKAGVSQTTISDIERERNQSSLELPSIAKALGVNVETLMNGQAYEQGGATVLFAEEPKVNPEADEGGGYELFARMLALQAGLLAVIRTIPYSPNLPPVIAQELARARDIMAANPIDEGSLDAFDNQAEAIRIAADIHHSR